MSNIDIERDLSGIVEDRQVEFEEDNCLFCTHRQEDGSFTSDGKRRLRKMLDLDEYYRGEDIKILCTECNRMIEI